MDSHEVGYIFKLTNRVINSLPRCSFILPIMTKIAALRTLSTRVRGRSHFSVSSKFDVLHRRQTSPVDTRPWIMVSQKYNWSTSRCLCEPEMFVARSTLTANRTLHYFNLSTLQVVALIRDCGTSDLWVVDQVPSNISLHFPISLLY